MPLNTPLAAAKDTDDACANEKEDRNLATVRHERIASVGRIGIQMRPRPYRAEGGVYSEISDNHCYNHSARSQSGQNAEPDEECREKLHSARNIYQCAKPVRIRPSGKVPQQECFLCAVQPKLDCEDQPEQQIELIRVWLQEPSKESRLLYTLFCHSPTIVLLFGIPILGVFRLRGRPRHDGDIIARFYKPVNSRSAQ